MTGQETTPALTFPSTKDATAQESSVATRPWFRKKRVWTPLVLIVLVAVLQVANGGGEKGVPYTASSASQPTAGGAPATVAHIGAKGLPSSDNRSGDMAEVVLFHHVQGLTDGVRAFAEQLRAGGHTVHTPDLFDGERPATIEDGIARTQSIGGEVLGERAARAVADLPEGLVYAGFSFGAGTAQRLAQTRPGARGALLYESCIPISGEWAFGPWPEGVPVQIHGMDKDPFFALEGDIDAARELVEAVGSELAELFVYPGDRHLFADSSLLSYDADATALVVQRSREFLDRVG